MQPEEKKPEEKKPEAERIQQVRALFPAVESIAYFNTGTCGPLPEVCAQAMSQEIHNSCRDGRGSIPEYMQYLEEVEALRADIARLVGAESDEIVMTQHTTEAMNHILWGMDWQAGDVILTSTHEHPALLTPLSLLHSRKGVDVVYVPLTGDPVHDLDKFEDAWGPQVRMVALSHVSWIDGFVLPIAEIAHICNDEGVPLLVDGAQSVGRFPVDVKKLGVDFYAAPAQKWLCGPEGMGFLYVHKDWFSRVKPTYTGIFGVRNLSWFDQTSPYYVPSTGARRFQQAGWFRPLIYGWRASLQLLEEEIGWTWIYPRSRQTLQGLRKALESQSRIKILTPRSSESGLVSFTWDGLDAKAVRNQLETQGIVLRDIPYDQTQRLRVSVGFFNDQQDIQRLMDALIQHLA